MYIHHTCSVVYRKYWTCVIVVYVSYVLVRGHVQPSPGLADAQWGQSMSTVYESIEYESCLSIENTKVQSIGYEHENI